MPGGKLLKVRKRVWSEAKGKCAYCQEELEFLKATVEHIVPRGWGGRKAGDNVIVACFNCNHAKGCLEALVMRDYPEFGLRERLEVLMVYCHFKNLSHCRKGGNPHRYPNMMVWIQRRLPCPTKKDQDGTKTWLIESSRSMTPS